MNICIIQHVIYESPGLIQNWIEESGYYYQKFIPDPGFLYPEVDDFDALIILGGPMGANDESLFPWLHDEKVFIRNFIDSGKRVLGICLGSQLVANVLGAKLSKNKTPEIGWFPIFNEKKNLPVKYQDVFPENFTTFHWHGDTFEIPVGAVSFAHSNATINQGFVYKNVAGFQFHMEVNPWMLKQLIDEHGSELKGDFESVQSEEEILAGKFNIKENKVVLYNFLNKFLA